MTVETLVRANTAFGLAMHTDLVSRQTRPNVLTAPYSLTVALAMTYAGARGQTAAEMAATLGFDRLEADVAPAVNALDWQVDPPASSRLAKLQKHTFRTANTVWGQADFPWREAYLTRLQHHYGAGLQTVDFRDDLQSAREQINTWVSEQTNGEIKRLFPGGSLTRRTRLVLSNAVYFSGSWAREFDEAQTEPQPFTTIEGSQTEVQMMRQPTLQEWDYYETGELQAVSLPYSGGSADMVLVVPSQGEFRAVEQSLTAERLHSIFEALSRRRGTVAVPKFSFGVTPPVKPTLQALGMSRVFAPEEADLTGMYNAEAVSADLFVQAVKHKTRISVNEQGTEAAAATGVVAGTGSQPTQPPFELTIDRPFLFCIRDALTDTVLFLGRVGDPAAAQ